MTAILVLVHKSFLNFRRARAAVAITFLVPVALIYVLGHVFGLYRKDAGPSGIPLAVVNLSSDPAAQALVDALRSEKSLAVITETDGPASSRRSLTESDVRTALRNNRYRFAVILPADLVGEHIGIRLRFLSNPRNEIEAQTVNGLLQKTIFSKVPELLGQSLQQSGKKRVGVARYDAFNREMATTISRTFGGNPDDIVRRMEQGDLFGGIRSGTETGAKTAGGNDNLLTQLVKIETEQVAGKDVKNPMASRLVGGYAIMFLLFAVSAGASHMFEERATGVFQRVLSSPVTPGQILGARFIWGVLLGLVQILALFVAGHFFFGLDLGRHLVPLVAISVAAAAACSAFGMFIAAISPSADAARGLSTFVVIAMSALGGAWFPVSFMPSYIQTISKGTIVYWCVEGFTDVLWAGRGLSEVMPKIGILLAIATAVMAISTWRFNRSRFFE